MATISKTGIATGQNITADHTLNIIEALDGTDTTDINIKGTLTLPDISDVSASLATALASSGTSFTAAGISGSLGTNATLIRGLTATSITGSFNAASSSLSTRVTTNESTIAKTLLSSSAQIASDISGSVVGATSLGTGATTVSVGPSTGRLTLSSAGINNTDQAFFYGGTNSQLDVGYGSSNKGRLAVSCSAASTRLTFNAGQDSALGNQYRITNYYNSGTEYSEIKTGDSHYYNVNTNGGKIMVGNEGSNSQFEFRMSSVAIANAYTFGGLYIARSLHVNGTGGGAYKPSGGSWTADSSDIRVKENIITASLDTCYDTVKNIPLKRYTWKDSSYSVEELADRSMLGWIAQDVQPYFPKSTPSASFTTLATYTGSISITGSDGIKIINPGDTVRDVNAGSEYYPNTLGLDETQLMRALYGAVQKLQIKVEALEAQISGSS